MEKMITEYDLELLPVNDLIDFMVIAVNQLFVLKKMKDREHIADKKKEIQLIQKMIASKRVPMFH